MIADKKHPKKPAGRNRSGLKKLIAGLVIFAVYEAALAVIAQRLLKKEMQEK